MSGRIRGFRPPTRQRQCSCTHRQLHERWRAAYVVSPAINPALLGRSCVAVTCACVMLLSLPRRTPAAPATNPAPQRCSPRTFLHPGAVGRASANWLAARDSAAVAQSELTGIKSSAEAARTTTAVDAPCDTVFRAGRGAPRATSAAVASVPGAVPPCSRTRVSRERCSRDAVNARGSQGPTSAAMVPHAPLPPAARRTCHGGQPRPLNGQPPSAPAAC